MERAGEGWHADRIDHLMHCANNCRHMLAAIDRKLAQALQHFDDGEVAKGRRLLSAVSTALPEAMAIIAHEQEAADEPDGGTAAAN